MPIAQQSTRCTLENRVPDNKGNVDVKNNDALRARLKGFVCHAPTEWDSSQNETRYAALNAPDGFYGKQQSLNPNGYAACLSLLKKFQFWDQASLPSDEVWFFRPLQFIRHFRRCGWLHPKENSARRAGRPGIRGGSIRSRCGQVLPIAFADPAPPGASPATDDVVSEP